ncbi:S66 family peptidase [Shouchella rhizosphaerae]|uniref:S66 family peptidase n=1 Tax=Shouchella rhizosphaerae TaxID=866786 RepID=UPI0009154FFB|nr:S66 peptidase family protein [Shouchella rhizosphaerae]SHL57327.1 Muramoyltetrapeptide carboxypeptidase LdcA (peptidoglycan recycling) [Shouchella rhizosphaerae]
MLKLLQPARLQKGDKVATVSLSWGGAGDKEIRWRYEQGKRRIEEVFGLEVVEMPHTLSPPDEVYRHPEKRAADFMAAFAEPSIKAIISCIGGNDSIRMLPYIDFELIRANPKIFTGYSDSTVAHLICLKAGLSSFYGVSVLNDFAENGGMHPYTVKWIETVLFSGTPVGPIPVAPEWTGEWLEWTVANKEKRRTYKPNHDYEVVQGEGVVQGPLIGGCFEVLEILKGTPLFPAPSQFDGAILFLETSEVHAPEWLLEDGLRQYGVCGILERLSGILFAKPQNGQFYKEYKHVIKKVLAEFNCGQLPVLYNASFGHNEPKCLLPYGARGEINANNGTFAILEPGVR